MKEHPILFSPEMVRAILAGRKTQTRRIIKPQPIIDEDSGFVFGGKHRKQYDIHNWKDQFIDDWSRWMPEDILWVREAFNIEQFPVAPEGDHDELLYYYKATEKEFTDMKWSPSIHMPKEAARMWLEVTNVTIEKLWQITEEDSIKEGIDEYKVEDRCYRAARDYLTGLMITDSHKDYRSMSYASLWRKINGHESWESNPWVWVIEFKVLSTTGRPQQLTENVDNKPAKIMTK